MNSENQAYAPLPCRSESERYCSRAFC